MHPSTRTFLDRKQYAHASVYRTTVVYDRRTARGSARREPATAPPARHRHDTPGTWTCDRYSTPYSRRGMDAWCRVRGAAIPFNYFTVCSMFGPSCTSRVSPAGTSYYECITKAPL